MILRTEHIKEELHFACRMAELGPQIAHPIAAWIADPGSVHSILGKTFVR
jgi:hypothetical protein